MSTIKLMNKDTHSLCPVPGSVPNLLPLQPGSKVKYGERTFTVKSSTAYMAWFNEKGFEVKGASKGSPQEIEIQLVTE